MVKDTVNLKEIRGRAKAKEFTKANLIKERAKAKERKVSPGKDLARKVSSTKWPCRMKIGGGIRIFFLLLAAKVRSSCEEGPGQSALQSAYHDPKLDVTE